MKRKTFTIRKNGKARSWQYVPGGEYDCAYEIIGAVAKREGGLHAGDLTDVLACFLATAARGGITVDIRNAV